MWRTEDQLHINLQYLWDMDIIKIFFKIHLRPFPFFMTIFQRMKYLMRNYEGISILKSNEPIFQREQSSRTLGKYIAELLLVVLRYFLSFMLQYNVIHHTHWKK